jgi:predicted MPP superfamily phosphohydrolase
MAVSEPAQVCWIFDVEDMSIARELLARADVLEAQGLVHNSMITGPGLDVLRPVAEPTMSAELVVRLESLRRVDVFMVLCSQALLDGQAWKGVLAIAAPHHVRVIPVLVSTNELPPELAAMQLLPRDGRPIRARYKPEEALLEVIHGLFETVQFRSSGARPRGTKDARKRVLRARSSTGTRSIPAELPTAEPTAGEALTTRDAPPGTNINDIFRLEGAPTFTFIEPPEFELLRLELRTMGRGLIVEGPSKVGKSTAIHKAMEALGIEPRDQLWWHGERLPPFKEFGRKLDRLLQATRNTWLFIDDFHRVEDERHRRELASVMKVLADQQIRRAKVTLIGINPLGNSLVQVLPDLSGRFRVMRIDIEKEWTRSTKIAELIIRGETAANLRFKRRDEFIVAAAGSFFLAQYLCNAAAVQAGVRQVPRDPIDVELGPVDAIAAIQNQLAAQFRGPMIELAAYDATPPPRGAALSLVWLLAQSSDGFISVREARLRFPMLNVAFEWLLASNLTRCFQEHPRLRGLLYYHGATQTLTMEDPQLKFYLRALNWEEFAAASGHGHVRFHSEDGPLWPIVVSAVGRAAATLSAIARSPTADDQPRRVLHLSDLHFATKDQATIWYSQLAADLREQRVDRLDAMIVSGDLVDRADPTEYDAARLFLEKLMSGFSLSARQVVLVPGNHDVSWSLGEEAYHPHKRKRYAAHLIPGAYIEYPHTNLIEVRDDDAYRKRFEPFAELYRAIKGVEYPLLYEEQAIVDDLPALGICILGLNSAWETDHHFRDRASIHSEALANALLKLEAPMASQLRIAVFHHPLQSGEDSRIRDTAFLQQLAVHGFRLALHGHVHKADAELYRYDRSERGRRIEIIAAGTFGANTREWVPGYPLEYNLLLIGRDKITVETRCRREINGAWEPDARWRQGPGRDPLPRYVIER